MENKNEDLKLDENEEIFFEPSSNHDYISSAYNALSAVDDFDTSIMSKRDKAAVNRIRRRCIRIIDHCLNDIYEELFDENSASDDADE